MRAYLTKKNTPQRMARKRARRDVFVANKKAAKVRRKEQRLLRRALQTDTIGA
jgi:hypothetical protein